MVDAQLVEDARHVALDRPLGDEQARRDLGVRGSIGDEPGHFQLASGERTRPDTGAARSLLERVGWASDDVVDDLVAESCRARRECGSIASFAERRRAAPSAARAMGIAIRLHEGRGDRPEDAPRRTPRSVAVEVADPRVISIEASRARVLRKPGRESSRSRSSAMARRAKPAASSRIPRPQARAGMKPEHDPADPSVSPSSSLSFTPSSAITIAAIEVPLPEGGVPVRRGHGASRPRRCIDRARVSEFVGERGGIVRSAIDPRDQ